MTQTTLDLAKELIAINSVNGNELAVAQVIHKWLTAAGIASEIDEFTAGTTTKRANLYAQIGPADASEVVVLTGHMDTVAVEDAAAWATPPFTPTVKDGKLFGRGAADMKSGLAALVTTFIAAAKWPLRKQLRLILTAGEEFGAQGAYRAQKQGRLAGATAYLVGEATDEQVIYSHSGSLNYRVQATGKAAHSSQPQAGINAISALVAFWQEEQQLFTGAQLDATLGKVQHSINVINGGEQVNTIAAQAELLGNVRPTKAAPNQWVKAQLKAAVARLNEQQQANYQLEILHDFYPVVTPKEHPFVQLAATVATQLGASAGAGELVVMNGATDASVFVQTTPAAAVVVLGPGVTARTHQVNEYTTLASLAACEQIYRKIIHQWCC